MVGLVFLLSGCNRRQEGISLDVNRDQPNRATVAVHIPAGIAISTALTMRVVLASGMPLAPRDEFGMPLQFALKSGGHEIAPGHYRVFMLMPTNRMVATFELRDGQRILLNEERTISEAEQSAAPLPRAQAGHSEGTR